MATMYNTVLAQYTDYETKLANKKYRESELSENTLVKETALLALYSLSAMENSSSHMTAILTELEDVSNATLTPPSLIISGLETEAAGAEDVAVTAGVNTITFPIALSTVDYALLLTSITADGNFNSYKRGAKTTAGFTLTVAEDGYIDYRAIIV